MKSAKNKSNQVIYQQNPNEIKKGSSFSDFLNSDKELDEGKMEATVSDNNLIEVERQLRKQNEVLVRIAKSGFMQKGDLKNAVREITEASAKTLGVDRVNAWLYNGDRSKIYCVDHYELSKNRHTKGLELAAEDYPSYFEALEKERIIAAHDARNDPRTREFSQTYLLPNGITSLLDAPVRKGGEMVGLVCHEHVGPARRWTNEDQSFAASIADFISLAFESRDRKQIEAELEESHSLLIATLESTADGLLVVDREGKIIRFNKKFIDMWNLPDSIILLRDDNKAIEYVLQQLKEPERFISKVKELYDQPQSESYDLLEFKDGRYFERYSKPQVIGKNIIGRVWSFRDVTNRKRAEQSLRESEERYRTLVEHTYDLISEASIDGRFLYLSANHKDILGFEPEELEGRNIFENIHPGDCEAVKREFKRIMETFSSGHVEFRIRHKNGEWRWIESSGKPLKTSNGEVRAVIASRDITEKKIAEVALKDSLDQLSKKNRYETIIGTVTRSVHQSTNLEDVMDNAVQSIRENIERADSVAIYIVEGEEAVLKAQRGYSDWYIRRVGRIPYPKGYAWKVIMDEQYRYCADVDQDTVIGPAGREFGIKSYLSMPISYEGKTIGVINVNSLQKDAFDEDELKLLELVREQITVALNNARQKGALEEALSEVERLKGRLLGESEDIGGGFECSRIFKDVKSRSILLQRSLYRVYQYASSDSTIFIQGETGTGKELIARSVHEISPRSQRSFVSVNCEELAKETFELELFGLEARGSVTGALSIRIGRFEIANNGTIYLEEIGAIPIELQRRLLRIIQEGVFTRSTNNRPIKVNVRVIASSKIDGGELVEEGKLSEELYNHINSFQVTIPPLRHRKEDIPLLARHFIDKHGNKLGKKIDSLPHEVVEYLQTYDWPGNVSELDKLLEQAINRSKGSTLELPDLIDLVVK